MKPNKETEEQKSYSYLDIDKFNEEYEKQISNEGKVERICKKVRCTLLKNYKSAPDYLLEEPDEKEIELGVWQKIGDAARNDLFKERRCALELSDLSEGAKTKVKKNIDELENVIKDSVKLIAKDRYATRNEIEKMYIRVAIAEEKLTYVENDSSFTI